jgi:hypothetical protein
MPAHKLGLIINDGEVDMLVFLELGFTSKVSDPILVVCVSILLSFSDKRLFACAIMLLLVAHSEADGGFFWMLVCTFSSARNSLSR